MHRFFASLKMTTQNLCREFTEHRADRPSAFGDRFPIRRLNPDPFRGGYTQRNPAGAGGQGQRLVVVAMCDMNFGSRTDAALFKKLKQAAIAFIDPTHLKLLSRFGLSQQQQAATATAGGTLHFS